MKLEEKGEKTDMKRNQRIISTYFKNPYFSKLENLKEINEILDMYDLPKLNQEYINTLNRLINLSDIKILI